MSILTIFLIASGLAMDAFAVSITSGLTIRRLRLRSAFRIALFFGSFQALMPIVGWLAGLTLVGFVAGFDHWIVFGLLTLIGVRMVITGIGSEQGSNHNPLEVSNLILLSIATSIDALVIGISFAFLKVVIIVPILIIGLVTFTLSFFGVYVGNQMGSHLNQRAEIIGGLVLILIGIKVLFEHLMV